MIAERVLEQLDVSDEPVSAYDAAIVRLTCVWLFLQCFQYQYLSPIFQIQIGITLSPDRLVLGIILILYFMRASHPMNGRVRMTWMERFLLGFALVGTASWLVTGADAGQEKFRWLTTLANLSYLPFLTHFIVSRLEYGR